MENGLNRFVWNYRLPDATTLPGLILWGGSVTGPRVVPGNYQVKLTVDGKLVGDGKFRASKPIRDFRRRRKNFRNNSICCQIRATNFPQTHEAILEIRDLKKQFEDMIGATQTRTKRFKGQSRRNFKKLTAVEEELIQTKIKSSQDALNFPIKLNNKLAALDVERGQRGLCADGSGLCCLQ